MRYWERVEVQRGTTQRASQRVSGGVGQGAQCAMVNGDSTTMTNMLRGRGRPLLEPVQP